MVAELISRTGISGVETTQGEEPRPLRWTLEEYYALDEEGLLEGNRVILMDGEIVSRCGRPRRWSLDGYHALIASGRLDGKRVQLIDGEIIEMSPMARPHALCMINCEEELRPAFGIGFFFQFQTPLPILLGSEPEPDVAIFRGRARDFRLTHPTNPVLVVEVSDSTLRYDRGDKASLYARAGVPEYWIVNIPERRLEIRREPIEDAQSRFLWRYSALQVLEPDAGATPLHASAPVRVLDLLP